jgi:hypothetical protein
MAPRDFFADLLKPKLFIIRPFIPHVYFFFCYPVNAKFSGLFKQLLGSLYLILIINIINSLNRIAI